jgi:hypothetical protein
MNQSLKTAILENKFVDKLRMEMVVDEQEYGKLITALKLLAQDWKDKDYIDKELMQDLYVLAPICHNMSPEIPNQTGRIEEMAIEIDAIVLDCLAIVYDQNDYERLSKHFGLS